MAPEQEIGEHVSNYNFQWCLIVGLKTCTDMQFVFVAAIFSLEIRVSTIAFNGVWRCTELSFTILSSLLLLCWKQAQCASNYTVNCAVVVCCLDEINAYLASSCSRIPLIADEWGPFWFTCTKRQKRKIDFIPNQE